MKVEELYVSLCCLEDVGLMFFRNVDTAYEDHNMNPANGATAALYARIRTVIVSNLLTAEFLTEVPVYLCLLPDKCLE
jgi:hypothetical protein